MQRDSTLEHELGELLKDAEVEQQKAEQRLVTVQRAVEVAAAKVAAVQAVLDMYRAKHGLSDPHTLTVDPQRAASYQNLSTRAMVDRWADEHSDEFVTNDAVKFFVAAGLFPDVRGASATVSAQVGRMSEFERVARGIYRRRNWVQAQAPVPISTQWRDQERADVADVMSKADREMRAAQAIPTTGPLVDAPEPVPVNGTGATLQSGHVIDDERKSLPF